MTFLRTASFLLAISLQFDLCFFFDHIRFTSLKIVHNNFNKLLIIENKFRERKLSTRDKTDSKISIINEIISDFLFLMILF